MLKVKRSYLLLKHSICPEIGASWWIKAAMPKPRQKRRVGNHTGDYSAALSTEKRPRGSETAYKTLREQKLRKGGLRMQEGVRKKRIRDRNVPRGRNKRNE